jgi:hypothetical protein
MSERTPKEQRSNRLAEVWYVVLLEKGLARREGLSQTLLVRGDERIQRLLVVEQGRP